MAVENPDVTQIACKAEHNGLEGCRACTLKSRRQPSQCRSSMQQCIRKYAQQTLPSPAKDGSVISRIWIDDDEESTMALSAEGDGNSVKPLRRRIIIDDDDSKWEEPQTNGVDAHTTHQIGVTVDVQRAHPQPPVINMASPPAATAATRDKNKKHSGRKRRGSQQSERNHKPEKFKSSKV